LNPLFGALAGPVGIGIGVVATGAMLASTPAGRQSLLDAANKVKEFCSPGDEDPCKELNSDVQRAKDKVGGFGNSACRPGMSRWDLEQRRSAWLDEATARAKRDQKCWAGGDAGHQQAQASAWAHVGNCARLLQ
jgi:Novel toxin 16